MNENSIKNKLVELEKFAVDSEERTKLERNLRGIINRLNEQTLLVALRNISEAFAVNGHNGIMFFISADLDFLNQNFSKFQLNL